MIARAHELGLKVIVDMVPNHSSDEHEWFQAALAAGPGSAERERYMFREGRGEHGELPPNNWESVFGGAAWTRVTEADGTPGQWYLHIFDTKQPDFNWEHPEVRAEFESILRFWLDRGVDGFRVDVAHGLIKEQGLPDTEEERTTMLGARRARARPRRTGTAPPRRRRASTTRSAARCGTRTASTRSTAPGARSSSPTARPTASSAPRRGSSRRSAPSPTSAPTRCTRRSTSTSSPPRGSPTTCAPSSPRRCTPRTPSAPRRRGCCRTTTSCATPRVSATHRARRG